MVEGVSGGVAEGVVSALARLSVQMFSSGGVMVRVFPLIRNCARIKSANCASAFSCVIALFSPYSSNLSAWAEVSSGRVMVVFWLPVWSAKAMMSAEYLLIFLALDIRDFLEGLEKGFAGVAEKILIVKAFVLMERAIWRLNFCMAGFWRARRFRQE